MAIVIASLVPGLVVPPGTHSTVVFLRHGQSTWNAGSLFTGWADVELTTLGKNEAARAATQIWEEGLEIDVAYTSRLKRARETLDIVLLVSGQEHVPVNACWQLNERMYGGLTGLNKKETAEKYGEEQVKLWRRSYDVRPPPVDPDSKYAPANNPQYWHIKQEKLPLSECLKDTLERTLPYWHGDISPALKRGKTVLVAAHGNSIRGILKYLDDIPEDEITELEIPTGTPLVYHLDEDLKPIKADAAIAPLSGVFLGDQEAVAKARQEVADQTKSASFGSEAAPEGASGRDLAEVQFACIGSGCLMLSNDDMRAPFDLVDTDSNGCISPAELKQSVLTLSDGEAELSDAEVGEIFAMCDRNNDGQINYEEFVQAITATSE